MREISLLLGGCLLFCCGCDSAMTPLAYKQWVNAYENGLHKQKEVGDYLFDVQYKPHLYLKIQEQGANTNRDSLVKWQAESTTMQYYDLHIAVKGGKTDILKHKTEDEAMYHTKQYYFSYQFQQDIYIEQGGERLPCLLFHFERSYDLTPKRTFVLGFAKREQAGQGQTLVIDSKLLGTGPVKISFEPIPTPEIKF